VNLSKIADLFRCKPKAAEKDLEEARKINRDTDAAKKRATREIQRKRAQTDTAFDDVHVWVPASENGRRDQAPDGHRAKLEPAPADGDTTA